MKFSTRGLKVFISVGSPAPTANPITSITNAKPAVVTPTTIANFANGDIVKITGTSKDSLDNKYFEVANKAGTTFELKCSDASKETAAATTGNATPYKASETGPDLVPFCIDSFSRERPAGEVISVATFCDPQANVAGEGTAGTISWGGPIDFCNKGFQEMMKAMEDGSERIVVLKFPNDIGSMVVPIEVNAYSESYNLNSAATFTGGAVAKTAPTLLTCECP